MIERRWPRSKCRKIRWVLSKCFRKTYAQNTLVNSLFMNSYSIHLQSIKLWWNGCISHHHIIGHVDLQTMLMNTAFNTLRPRQNARRFADDTFKRIFLNENARISIKISLKFVPKGSINNNPALVQIMAWRRSGDKPLSEPMMVSLLTHICGTRPQWVKWNKLFLIAKFAAGISHNLTLCSTYFRLTTKKTWQFRINGPWFRKATGNRNTGRIIPKVFLFHGVFLVRDASLTKSTCSWCDEVSLPFSAYLNSLFSSIIFL